MAAPRISRRTALRGLGTAISLPLLEAMLPSALAATPSRPVKVPTRLAFLYVPNGVHMPAWRPKDVSESLKLPELLAALEPFKAQICLFSGLAQDKARSYGDGGGDHARAVATFLTGIHPKKTLGANIQAGTSVDQLVAAKIGQQTKFPSLELGTEPGAQSGACDTGYSCVYTSCISWKNDRQPLIKETNPRLVFDRLFDVGHGDDSRLARLRRQKYRKSVLDFALEDARSLSGRLGGNDRRKLDEYLSSVREIETRLEKTTKENRAQLGPNIDVPLGIPSDYSEHVRLMGDMMVMAFQADLTRVGTFMLANDGSNRSYRQIGVSEGHHDLSHHGNDKQKQDKVAIINRFHIDQLAYFLRRLKQTSDGNGTLLDHSMIVYGSGISDGDRHNHDDLPVLLAGGGNGTIRGGRHHRFTSETPLNNLWMSLLDRMNCHVESFGDSTGKIALG